MIQEGDRAALDPLEILVEYAAAQREKETGKRPGHFLFILENLKETIYGDTSLSPDARAQLLLCISVMDQLDRDDDPEALLQQIHWILAKHHIPCEKLDDTFLHSLLTADEKVIPYSEATRILCLLKKIHEIRCKQSGEIPSWECYADPILPAP